MTTTRTILASALAVCLWAPPPAARGQAAAPGAEVQPSPTVVPPGAGPAAAATPAGTAPTAAPPPSAPWPPTERRRTFWGAEPGRPYEEVDAYALPSLPIHLSGYAWIDAGWMQLKPNQAGQYDKDVNYSQGRVVLAASYRRDVGPVFAEARAEYVAFDNEYTKSQYEPHTQDAFVRVGGRLWDVQIGRFLGWEPYYRGNGIDRYTAEENGANGPSMYRLDYALGYMDEPGQLAIHVYPTGWLAFELGSVYGQQQSQNDLGVRPVLAVRKFGFLLIGGAEYVEQKPQDSSNKVKATEKGAAGRLAYTFRGTTVGVNLAKVKVEATQIDGLVDAAKSFDKTTVGAYLESDFWDNVVGAGYHVTTLKNDKGETNKHHQAFLSYVYRLPVPGLSLWGVLGYARAELEDVDARSSWEPEMTSFRVRVRYDFR